MEFPFAIENMHPFCGGAPNKAINPTAIKARSFLSKHNIHIQPDFKYGYILVYHICRLLLPPCYSKANIAFLKIRFAYILDFVFIRTFSREEMYNAARIPPRFARIFYHLYCYVNTVARQGVYT